MKFKNIPTMVTKLRFLLTLKEKGVSQRKISELIDLSRTSVKKYLERFISSGKSFKELQSLDDASLLQIAMGRIYRQKPDQRYGDLKPLLERYAKELKKPYVTIQLLWEEYQTEFQEKAYSYTTFKHYLTEYIRSTTYKYHNTHEPGGTLQVDFAGDKLHLTDKVTGEIVPVVVLCCTLPCSGYSYVQALPDASMENLFPALSNALEYIGGVPESVLSDNMKQWVKKRDKNGPIFTDAAIEFSVHYSTMLRATNVRKPTHKAAVEGVVHIAYNRIYAKIRNDVFYTIEELNNRILELLEEFNSRKMKDKAYSREEFFIANEKDYLQPLPSEKFSLRYTKQCKVANNYHVFVSTHQYSVPYEYVNKEVNIIYDNSIVEIYNEEYQRIAIHPRSFRQYGYTTNRDHMPPRHVEYENKKGQRNAAYYLNRAGKISDSVRDVIEMVLKRATNVEVMYNSCEAILQLEKIDKQAFIKSCEYIKNKLQMANYNVVRSVMETKAYLKEDNTSSASDQLLHDNLRGKDAYIDNK